ERVLCDGWGRLHPMPVLARMTLRVAFLSLFVGLAACSYQRPASETAAPVASQPISDAAVADRPDAGIGVACGDAACPPGQARGPGPAACRAAGRPAARRASSRPACPPPATAPPATRRPACTRGRATSCACATPATLDTSGRLVYPGPMASARLAALPKVDDVL